MMSSDQKPPSFSAALRASGPTLLPNHTEHPPWHRFGSLLTGDPPTLLAIRRTRVLRKTPTPARCERTGTTERQSDLEISVFPTPPDLDPERNHITAMRNLVIALAKVPDCDVVLIRSDSKEEVDKVAESLRSWRRLNPKNGITMSRYKNRLGIYYIPCGD